MWQVFPFLNARRFPKHAWDEVLFQTQNFLVVPTVGALVEGWFLIVTKNHFLSMGAINPELRSELLQIKEFVCEAVLECYGDVAVFEHGPSRLGQSVGCGVDHAHLHILPAPRSLIDDIPCVAEASLEWLPVDGMNSTQGYFLSGTPYLYVEQPLGNASIADATAAPSQLFRKVVAHQIGSPVRFDWRDHPIESNVVATVTRFKRYLSRNVPSVLALSNVPS